MLRFKRLYSIHKTKVYHLIWVEQANIQSHKTPEPVNWVLQTHSSVERRTSCCGWKCWKGYILRAPLLLDQVCSTIFAIYWAINCTILMMYGSRKKLGHFEDLWPQKQSFSGPRNSTILMIYGSRNETNSGFRNLQMVVFGSINWLGFYRSRNKIEIK